MPGPERGAWRGGPPFAGPRGRPPGRFVRRIALLLILALFSFFLIGAIVGHLVTGSDRGGPPPHALVLLLPIGLIMFVLARGLRQTAAPIGLLMNAADRVAGGDFAVRVPEFGSRDIAPIMTAFNSMVARLQVNDEQRRLLLGDIAHELRNPLAILRGNVEGMIDGIYPRDNEHLDLLIEETIQMSRLLDDLQILSQAETGTLVMQPQQTDLTLLLTEVHRLTLAAAQSRDIELLLRVTPGLTAWVDPARLRQVIENVLANALRHTPPGGRIEIGGGALDQQAQIIISDTGAGIPPDLIPHLFDRFVKSADSGGSGLGLAIARQLVEAQHGTISAANRADGGAEIRILLPARSPD